MNRIQRLKDRLLNDEKEPSFDDFEDYPGDDELDLVETDDLVLADNGQGDSDSRQQELTKRGTP